MNFFKLFFFNSYLLKNYEGNPISKIKNFENNFFKQNFCNVFFQILIFKDYLVKHFLNNFNNLINFQSNNAPRSNPQVVSQLFPHIRK